MEVLDTEMKTTAEVTQISLRKEEFNEACEKAQRSFMQSDEIKKADPMVSLLSMITIIKFQGDLRKTLFPS